jgi:hypothetical protein
MLVDEAWERGRLLEVNSKLTAEAGIDWGHTVTAMHIIQDTKERYLVPKTHVWELVELTERCEEIADICIKNKIDVIYSDTSPKDSNITLKRILAKRRLKTKLIPIAFGKYKSTGINVIRYLLRLGIIDIQNSEFKKKLQQYHYKNSEQELIAKEDDHLPDALTAWAVSRGTLLGKKFN